MSSQNTRLAAILKLLWEGKKAEAKEAVIAERVRLLDVMDSVANDLSMLDAISPPDIGNKIAPPPPPPIPAPAGRGIVSSVMAAERIKVAADKDKRNSAILKYAKEIGTEKRTGFHTTDIRAKLEEKGISMCVADNRADTVISRLLLQHENEFTKIDTGFFKLNDNVSFM